MAWFSGKVSLGGFPDLAGAVNKLQESVKNIEKNFDSALGFEEKSDNAGSSSEASGLWSSATERKTLFNPVMAFMGHTNEENAPERTGSPGHPSIIEGAGDDIDSSAPKQITSKEEAEVLKIGEADEAEVAEVATNMGTNPEKSESIIQNVDLPDSETMSTEPPESAAQNVKLLDTVDNQKKEISEMAPPQDLELVEAKSEAVEMEEVGGHVFMPEQVHIVVDAHEDVNKQATTSKEIARESSPVQAEVLSDSPYGERNESSGSRSIEEADNTREFSLPSALPLSEASEMVPKSILETDQTVKAVEVDPQPTDSKTNGGQHLRPPTKILDSPDTKLELEKMKKEMKMMEVTLKGAARQAQAKADEIAKLMNENEQLKVVIEGLKRKSNEVEIESLREEYHQRVATLERKVYALTKERDTLRREQSKKSDAAALLKEKDEIINQVMAEGEELSKKQAAQESTIRKLRAQIRDLEEEKKGLITKLQVEENKIESIKKDKTATEKLLQETIEKHQSELSAQKEYYANALTAANEAEALAEARANSEARTEVESRLREAEEREAMLVQAVEELRQTLSRKEQQAVFREDMLLRDMEDLQKRYQASERRCEELVTQVPESTRPLLRQIEAMQETTARRAEAWAAVERSLNSRLQEAEAKAAAAEERERSVNERLSQTLSRISVLEAQISCLRAEQTQLSRSLEKERQRAAENRQEYLAAKEEADTQVGRVNQLEEEIRELRRKHKQDLQDAIVDRELLQQELEREKAARLDLEMTARADSTAVSERASITRQNSAFENVSSASSIRSMEESYFLQASLDSSNTVLERRTTGETSMNPYYMKSMTPSAFEATLRQKEGELASYMSRLASMESVRDSLAEELVKMTAQCEKLRAEATMLPSIRAELEALRRRHSAALELMGERDEELEELRADIVDLKEMYREQVNLLVNKIQVMSSSIGNSS